MQKFNKILFCIFVIIFSFNININAKDLNITSPAAIVMETSTGRILYSKNERSKRKIASTTKLMTAMVAIDNCNLEDMVEVSKNAAAVGGSEVGIKAGDKITLKALLYGLMLESGNDCAVAIAEHVSGSQEEFAKLMNKKALKIGAKDTCYTNAHGLDTEDNHCTAYDLALIACEVLKYPDILNIMGTEQINIKMGDTTKYLANTNRLLRNYEYCIGGKTGFTNGANRCIVTFAKKEDMQIVTVVLGSETTDIRFSECRKLMEYGINTYSLVDISEYMNWYINIPVYKGAINNYEKYITENMVVPLKEGELEQIYVKQTILPVIRTPMYKGNILGDIAMYIGEEKIYETEVILDRDLKKNDVWYYMFHGIKDMFTIDLELF